MNRNGFKSSIKSHIYKIQPKDLVWVDGKVYNVIGMHNKGKSVRVKINEKNAKSFGIKKVEKVFNFGSLVWNLE